MNILRSSPAVFLIAMIAGILFPSFASFSKDLVIPALAFVMTLSLGDLKLGGLELKKGVFNLILNYAFLSGLILLLSSFLADEELRLGFVVMAAAPPAVAIVPFSKLLGGDVAESTFSNGIIYLASLLLTPVIILLFTGEVVGIYEILKALVILILVPLIISRFFKVKDSAPWINIGFAIVIYTVVGLNVDVISRNFLILSEVLFIGLVRTFGSGSLIFFAFRQRGFPFAITKALFSSYKNLGFTAGVSLILFGERASIPAAICIFLEILLFNYYYFLKKNFYESKLISSSP
ncbi:MAG: hypothetical protein H0Z28_09040 [Archaeoglobus sp.]|nr:hypothetical protein [Archaeoglobus sp.]